MERSRTKKDHQDCTKFLDWLSLRNPFLIPDYNLHSLLTGLISTEKDDVNCEKTEDVGRNIQATLDEVFYKSASIRRKDQVKPLQHLQHTIKKQSDLSFYSCLIFNRLITIATQEERLDA